MKKILMVCEAFGGGVFTYVSQLCNDMVDSFDVYLAYSLRPQTPKNYKEFLDERVHLIEMKHVGVKGLTNLKSDIAAIKELRQIEQKIQPDVIHLHSSVAGGLGRLAYKGKNNTVVYTPHGYAHILMGSGKKSLIYKTAEKILGNRDELKSLNIEITGWVKREEALRYSLQGDVFILTSLWEGLPISLLESMYMRKLCVVNNVIGNRDVIHNGENGFVCDSVDDFVEAIREAGNHQDYIDNAYYDVLNEYNTEVMAENYSKIYLTKIGMWTSG